MEIPNNGIDDDCNPATDDALGVDDFKWEAIKIYPNPFSDYISIHIPFHLKNEYFKIELFDLNGRLVFKNNQPSINGIIDVRNLEKFQSALYFIKISNLTSNKTVIKSIIKN